jgi:RNA polymerase sigma-70 factor (ECF subfamily)
MPCVIQDAGSVSLIERIQSARDEALASEIAREPRDELCAELFRRYSKKIYLWSFGYTHDVEEAIELSQEIFMKIFTNIQSFSGLSLFSTWVYQVTKNHCLGELSKKRVQWRKRLHSLEDGRGAEAIETEFQDRVDTLEDLERILEAARGCMETDELEAFVLHYREGLTVNEITQILGCENATGARTLIQNARRKFGRLVQERGFGNA